MKIKITAALWLCLAACLSASVIYCALPEKPLGYVSDFAKILAPDTISEINALLENTEKNVAAEIAVVTVDTLDGAPVEDYAVKLFEKWGIGKKGKNNGVLLLVAVNERKIRIEVGYGLEPVLPDSLTGDIIRQDIAPSFKSGDFNGGILNGANRISGIVMKNEPAVPQQNRNGGDKQAKYALAAMLAFFILLGSFMAGIGIGARSVPQFVGGTFITGIPFILHIFNAVGSAFMAIFILMGIGALIKGMRLARSNPGSFRRGRYNTGGWVWGAPGGFGGGLGGGGFGGGGFGGFGGGFSGGGGASGGW